MVSSKTATQCVNTAHQLEAHNEKFVAKSREERRLKKHIEEAAKMFIMHFENVAKEVIMMFIYPFKFCLSLAKIHNTPE